jgi:hypothetical protein
MRRVRLAVAGAVLAATAVTVTAPEAAAAPAAPAVPASLPCTYFAPHGVLDDVIVSYLDHETSDIAVFWCVARHGNTAIRHRYWIVHWKRSDQWTWHPA